MGIVDRPLYKAVLKDAMFSESTDTSTAKKSEDPVEPTDNDSSSSAKYRLFTSIKNTLAWLMINVYAAKLLMQGDNKRTLDLDENSTCGNVLLASRKCYGKSFNDPFPCGEIDRGVYVKIRKIRGRKIDISFNGLSPPGHPFGV